MNIYNSYIYGIVMILKEIRYIYIRIVGLKRTKENTYNILHLYQYIFYNLYIFYSRMNRHIILRITDQNAKKKKKDMR